MDGDGRKPGIVMPVAGHSRMVATIYASRIATESETARMDARFNSAPLRLECPATGITRRTTR